MRDLKKKYLLANLAVMVGALVLSCIILYFATGSLNVYELVPIVFFYWALYELGFLWFCRMVERNPKRMPLSFSVVKGVRFVVLVGFVVYFSFMHTENLKWNLILFAAYFIIWLLFDTIFFFKNNDNLLKAVQDNEN